MSELNLIEQAVEKMENPKVVDMFIKHIDIAKNSNEEFAAFASAIKIHRTSPFFGPLAFRINAVAKNDKIENRIN